MRLHLKKKLKGFNTIGAVGLAPGREDDEEEDAASALALTPGEEDKKAEEAVAEELEPFFTCITLLLRETSQLSCFLYFCLPMFVFRRRFWSLS